MNPFLNEIATGAVISQVLAFLMKALPNASNRLKVVITIVVCLLGGTVNYMHDNGGTLDRAFKKDGYGWVSAVIAVLAAAWAYHEKVVKPFADDNKPTAIVPTREGTPMVVRGENTVQKAGE